MSSRTLVFVGWVEEALEVAAEALKGSEGFRGYVYDDATWPSRRVYEADCYLSGGQWKVHRTGGTATIGYGETNPEIIARHWNDEMSERAGTVLLMTSVEERYFRPIRSLVAVDLNPNQWAALISFAYNVGVGGFSGSTVRQVINAGPPYGGSRAGRLRDAFMMWTTGNYPGELAGRRQAELDVFFTPWQGSSRRDRWRDLFVPVLVES